MGGIKQAGERKLSPSACLCYRWQRFVKMEGKEMSVDDVTIMEFALKYPVNIRGLALKGTTIKFEATPGERLQLAQNHNLVRVDSFIGDFRLVPWQEDGGGKNGVRLSGRVIAQIVQRCIVSGEALHVRVEEPIALIFMFQDSSALPAGDKMKRDVFLNVDEDDQFEWLSGHNLDIGAVAEEFFDLAIDPYPRKEGAVFAQTDQIEAEQAATSPFAVLAKLK